MNRTKKEVISVLQQFLIDNDMTVKALASDLKVSKQTVYRWLDGTRSPSNRHYAQLDSLMKDYEPQWVIDMDETKLKEYLWNKEKE